MGQVLHGSATTTEAIRRAIQHSQASLRALAKRYTTPGAGGSAVPEIEEAIAKGELFRAHAFELACAKAGIEHRTTKPKHPWTNGQVERMNRTIKDATVKRFHYDDHQLRRHLTDF